MKIAAIILLIAYGVLFLYMSYHVSKYKDTNRRYVEHMNKLENMGKAFSETNRGYHELLEERREINERFKTVVKKIEEYEKTLESNGEEKSAGDDQ